MTELLEQAIARLKTLPTDEQDAIATLILEELEEEQQWDESFDRSPDLLAKPDCTTMAGTLKQHGDFLSATLSLHRNRHDRPSA
jgi:hypothetical protein